MRTEGAPLPSVSRTAVSALDAWLPEFDVRRRHELEVAAPPERALAAVLGTPAGCDRLTRVLLSLRGMRGASLPLERFLVDSGFDVLERTPTTFVVGVSGRPWRPSGRLAPFTQARPGTVQMLADLRAEPLSRGRSRLSTETRVAAADEDGRRAFRRYWRVVGPLSALIRRRWLAAAARSIAAANRSVAPVSADR